MAIYVQGPADGVSTDNALARWDATTGRLVQNSGVTLSDAGALAFPVGGSVTLSNVVGANSESALATWAANTFSIDVTKAGAGVQRNLELTTGGGVSGLQLVGATPGLINLLGSDGSNATIACTTTNRGLKLRGRISTSTTVPGVTLDNNFSLTAAAGTQTGVQSTLDINQSATAGYKALRVVVTETTTGSGQKDLASFEVAGAQRNRIGQNGNVYASMQTAIPAGGAANTGYFFSSTAGFGVYFGSGAPSVSAAKGSLYLRSDGSGATDRAYINTDGGTTWTALATAA